MIVDSFPPVPTTVVTLAGTRFRKGPLPTLKDRLAFGGPIYTAVTNKYHPEDEDLHAFIQGKAGIYRYVLAHLSLTFLPTSGPELETAEVQIDLTDDGSPPDTIAYSLLPIRAGSPYEQTRGYTVSPSLKLGAIGSVEASLGSVGQSTVEHGQRDFLLGGPELSPRPAWRFQPTPTQKLVGATRLTMIIQTPAGRTGTMSIDLHAEVEQGRFRKRRVPLLGGSATDPGKSTF